MQLLHTFSFVNKAVKKILVPFLLFFAQHLHSQVTDSAYIETLYDNGWRYIYTNPDSASWFFEKGKIESENRKYYRGIVRYHNSDAALRIALGENQKALEHYDQAIATARKNDLNTDLGLTYMKKGTLSQFMGEYAGAAEAYLAAASLLKTNDDRKEVIGLYNNIISTLNNLQQQNQSLQNVLPALKNNNTSEKEIAAILSQKKASETVLDFPDQATLRGITGGQTYVIFGGAKFLIADLYILNEYSNYRSIRKIPDGMLSRIPDIPRDGTILKQSNDKIKVYLIKDKLRHLIENTDVLQFFGGWDALCIVPESTLEQVPDAGDTVTMQNVLTTFNFKKEYEVLIDTLKTALLENKYLLEEVGKKLKIKNNTLQKRKTLLWTSFVGITALLCIGLLLVRNFRQKQKLHQQSIQALKAEEELQRKMAIEKERTRIAADMHDDLGAGLSTIRFLSEKVKRNTFSDVTKNDAEKIVTNSNELVQKMNEIIWAMNEKNDTLEDLLFYTRSYAVEYCEENHLACETHLPEIIAPVFVSGEIRRNVFLTVKESLHNIVKHANAKKVIIDFTVNTGLSITIKDDGKGLGKNGESIGNGLRNMKKRIESVNGIFEVISTNGVMVEMKVPLQL